MSEIKSSDCKAKDPRTCRYHGAVLRMEEAYGKQDFAAYVAARNEVDRLKKDPTNDFFQAGRKSSSQFSSRGETRTFQARQEYLENSGAVPTPLEAWALWVAVYQAQGGAVKPLNANYNQFSRVISKDDALKEPGFSYASLAWSRWTPTRNGVPIPAGYGSAALDLLVLPDVVNQPFTPATDDRRKGWEWGHTRVYTLSYDDNGVLKAQANSKNIVYVHEDVEQYKKGKSLDTLLSAFNTVQQKHAPLSS